MRLIVSFFIVIITLFSCKANKVISKKESKYYTDSIYSNYLKEYRKHSIYLPKNFNPKKKYAIVYATDGGIDMNPKKEVLDSLINYKIIEPILFIESHCNNKIADSTSTTFGDGRKLILKFRNFEYLDSDINTIGDQFLSSRFSNHMNYFIKEFIVQNEVALNLRLNKNDRFFYGVSNGAGFGISLLNKHPDLIGTYLCFSTFGGDIQKSDWKRNMKYPNVFMIYGSKEPDFLKEDSSYLIEQFKKSNSFIEVKQFEGGHDYKIWKKQIINYLAKLFPAKR